MRFQEGGPLRSSGALKILYKTMFIVFVMLSSVKKRITEVRDKFKMIFAL
jgi:hypothetical protein